MTAAARLHRLVDALSATEQQDVLRAAEASLGALLDGAVALQHMRMYPEFAAEAVNRVLTATMHKSSLRRRKR